MASEIELAGRGMVTAWFASIGSRFMAAVAPENENRRRNMAFFATLGLGVIMYYSYNRGRKNAVENYTATIIEKQQSARSTESSQHRASQHRVPKVSTTGTYLRHLSRNQLPSNSSSNSLRTRERAFRPRDRNQPSMASTLASNPPQIRTTPIRTRHPYDDTASIASDFTSVSQQNYYNCQSEMVRFRVPENRYAGSDIEDLHPDARQELHDCMVGIERLLESAQLAIDSPSCKNSLENQSVATSRARGTLDNSMMGASTSTLNDSVTASALLTLRQDVTDIKLKCRDIESRSRRNSMASSRVRTPEPSVHYSMIGNTTTNDYLRGPDSPGRMRNQPSMSAMSCLSDATDGWFSCTSGTSTPRNLTPSPSSDDIPGVIYLSENSPRVDSDVTVTPRRVQSVNDVETKFFLYQQRREKGVDSIPYRKDRSVICHCKDLEDFQVKVAILRDSFNNLLGNVAGLSNFLCLTGRYILTGILIAADKVPGEMQMAYDAFVEFSSYNDPEKQLEELRHRKVKVFNFFDIVIDYILLDAFTDLENPPATVKSVLTNRWLGDRFKETALQTSVWSIIKAKKGRVSVKNGFLFHYYSLWESVSPVLAWGFMGPKSMNLASLCDNLYRHVLGMIEDMFSFQMMDYSSQQNFERKLCDVMLQRFQHCINLVRNSVENLPMPEELATALRKVDESVAKM